MWWNDAIDRASRAKKQAWKNRGYRELYKIARRLYITKGEEAEKNLPILSDMMTKELKCFKL